VNKLKVAVHQPNYLGIALDDFEPGEYMIWDPVKGIFYRSKTMKVKKYFESGDTPA
jgi:hypothetical protein